MTIAEIRRFAQTTNKFLEAQTLFEKGNVVFPKNYLNKKKFLIEVLENNKIHKVTYTLKDNQQYLKCNCDPEIENCVHTVAALLKQNFLQRQHQEIDLTTANVLDCKEAELIIENVSLEILAGGWNLKLGFCINLNKTNRQPNLLRLYTCDEKYVYFQHIENDKLHAVKLKAFSSQEHESLLLFCKLLKKTHVTFDKNSLIFPLKNILKAIKENKKQTIFLLNDDPIDNILFLRSQHKINGMSHVCGFSGKKVFDFVTYDAKQKNIILRLAYLDRFSDFKMPYTINIYKLRFWENLFFRFLIQLKLDGFKNIFFQSEEAIVKEADYLPKMYFSVEFDATKGKFISDAFFKYKNKTKSGTTTVYPHRYYLAKKGKSNLNRLLFYEEAIEQFYQDEFSINYFRRFESTPVQDKNLIETFKYALEELKPIDLAEVSISANLLTPKQLKFSVDDITSVTVEEKRVKISINNPQLNLKLIKQILHAANRGSVVCIDQDGWYDLKQPAAKALVEFWNQIELNSATTDEQGNIFLPKYHLFEITNTLTKYKELDSLFDQSTLSSIKAATANQFQLTLDKKHVSKLRKYQQEGVKWIRGLEDNKFGGILADEMGLGKTIQVIYALQDSYITTQSSLPSLIIVPASLLLNWANEFKKFAPHMKVITTNKPIKERMEMYEKLTNEILLVSFNVLRSDVDIITKRKFHYVVIDEAQGIKNDSSLITKTAKKIKANFCLALTGTPIENRLLDLWSCFDFVLPAFLGNKKQFVRQFERVKTTQSFERLTKRTSPFILRRTKNSVLKELPDKIHTDIFVELSTPHQKLYDEERQLGLAEIKQVQDKSSINILTLILKLRHLCSLPQASMDTIEYNAKQNAALGIIREAIENSRKVLLFTQFLDVIDHLSQTLKDEGIDFINFDGRKSPKVRQGIIEKFNNAKKPCIMLASLKTGGVGINLTAAEVVIHFDVWWNTAVQDQATDRVHRIGQTKTVQVYKIIAKNTIEERICQVQCEKQELAKKTLIENVNFFESLSKEELLSLFE